MARLHASVLSILAAAALAGCSDSDGNGSTSISFTGNTASAAIDGGGTVKIDTPVFKGDIKVPKLAVDSSDFDINGVHLYPGSTITSMDVNAGDKDDSRVRIAFKSPAPAATVRAWLKERFDKAGFKLAPDGDGLTGKTDKGEDFRLTLAGDGPNAATGTIVTGTMFTGN